MTITYDLGLATVNYVRSEISVGVLTIKPDIYGHVGASIAASRGVRTAETDDQVD